ncbi:helix-turn-helix domain-containing protein [Bacillus sp. DJP31]|uniref:ATP synthase beta subunit C-terminal domain-containing protein n=1 Tax=Bacillus sp. DJP31 TaxID=3409789 RepID=UPI003BB4C286
MIVLSENLHLNVALLKRNVPNLTTAARAVGLRSATVSNLCTGKIPVGRAEVKTLVALADLAKCTLDELIIRSDVFHKIETGIKVFDLFAPLVQGGTTGLVARTNMGQLVVVAEVFNRLSKRGYQTVFLQTISDYPNIEDIRSTADHVFRNIEDLIEWLRIIDDKEKVVLATDRSVVLSGDLYTLRDRMKEAEFPPLTTLLFDPSGEVVDEEDPYGPLDTLWQFDMDLVARKIYPSVNPVLSTSIILEDALVDSNHLTVQRRAKKYLRRYREVRTLVNEIGLNRIHKDDVQHFHRGERLEAFLSQPFFVAEEYTGIKGESVILQDILTGIQSILDGGADDIDVNELKYVGKFIKK